MRVLHVIPSLSPLDGGPTQAVLDLAQAGREAGAQVDVAASTFPGEPVAPWPAVGQPDRLFLFPRPSRGGGWKFSLALTRWVFAHAHDYDLLHVHSVFSSSALMTCLAALAARRPYVLMPHGALDPWSMTQSTWKKRPYLLIMRPFLRLAKALQAASPKEARSLAGFGLGARTRLVPLAVDIPDVAPAFAPMPASDQSRPPALLFLSRLHSVKGLPVLLEALALLRDQGHACTLTVAGDGDADYRARLTAQVQGLGLETRVRFLGFVGGEDKARAFAEADIFVLPSFQESFGLAAVEAMGHGLPVVVSDQVPLGAEILARRAGEVAAVGSPKALAEALVRLFEPERRKEAAGNARALAQDSYGRGAMRQALAAMYAEALGTTDCRQPERGLRAPDPAQTTPHGWTGALRSLGRTLLWVLRSLSFTVLYVWHGLLRSRPLAVSGKRLLVLAPHPDDESLGCGGLLAAKARDGVAVQLLVLTDGRYGGEEPSSAAETIALRRAELLAAMQELGVGTAPVFLDCEDGHLARLSGPEREALVQGLADVLRSFRPEEIALPNPRDCHQDHEAVLDLAREAMARTGCQAQLYGYFIWAFWCLSWHWRKGQPVPLLCLNISDTSGRKRRAMRCHASQMPRLPWVVRHGSLLTRTELYCSLKADPDEVDGIA